MINYLNVVFIAQHVVTSAAHITEASITFLSHHVLAYSMRLSAFGLLLLLSIFLNLAHFLRQLSESSHDFFFISLEFVAQVFEILCEPLLHLTGAVLPFASREGLGRLFRCYGSIYSLGRLLDLGFGIRTHAVAP